MGDVKYTAVKTDSGSVTIFEGDEKAFELDKITYLTDLSNTAFYVVCSDLGRPVIYGVNKGFPTLARGSKYITPTSRIWSAMAKHDDLVLWEHIRVLEVSSGGSTLRLIAPHQVKPVGLLSIDSEQVKLNLFGVKVRFKLTDEVVTVPWADEIMSTLLWMVTSGFGYHQEVGKGLIAANDSIEGIRWECYPTLKSICDKYKRITGG